MKNPLPNPLPEYRRRESIVAPAVIAAGVALTCAILLYLITGTTLGLFFGGIAFVTLLLPPMVLQRSAWMDQAILGSAVNDSIGLVWFASIFTPHVSFVQWLLCYLVLASYAFALWGWTRAARAVGLHPVLASASAVIVGLLWLTWPIWLARAPVGRVVGWLVDPHPLLAINGVLKHLGIWSEQRIAYNHLMNLGQDVAYALPESIVPAVFVHVIIGGILFAIASAKSSGKSGDFG